MRSRHRALRSCRLGGILTVSYLKLREPSWSAQRVTMVAYIEHSGNRASRSNSLGGALRASRLKIREPGWRAQPSHLKLWDLGCRAQGVATQAFLKFLVLGLCTQDNAPPSPVAWLVCSRHCSSSFECLGGTLIASCLSFRGLGR